MMSIQSKSNGGNFSGMAYSLTRDLGAARKLDRSAADAIAVSATQDNAWVTFDGRLVDDKPSSPQGNTSPSNVVGGDSEAPVVENPNMVGSDRNTDSGAGSMALTMDNTVDVQLRLR